MQGEAHPDCAQPPSCFLQWAYGQEEGGACLERRDWDGRRMPSILCCVILGLAPLAPAAEAAEPAERQERQVKQRVETWRRVYIRKQDLEKFGFTDSCPACRIIKDRRFRSGCNHSEACRERIVQAMQATEDGRQRLAEAQQREETFVENALQAAAAAHRRGARRALQG